MAKKLPEILTLAAAIVALSATSVLNPTLAAANAPSTDPIDDVQKDQVAKAEPNVFMAIGSNLLGLVVSTTANGTVVADHYSHSSHSSHSSHYSSR